MNKLIQFEFSRNKKKFLIFSGSILLAHIILFFLDPDSEKATISISILVLLLPFIYLCIHFIQRIRVDFSMDTRYLYLSSARTKNEILGSRLLTTSAYAAAYILIVTAFQGVNVLQGTSFIIATVFSLTVLLAQALAGSIVYKKCIQI